MYSLRSVHEHLPVFRRSGGLSYGATYAGPIGIILDPTFNAHKYSKLPFSSTLNGSCASVCPVKINIHEQIADWREVMSETHELPLMKKAMMQAAGVLLSSPALYRAALPAADSALRHLPRFIVYNRLNTWGRGREVPHAPKQWYKENRGASR
jgi:L-lactate dehydrogenase complex protein LldF